MRALLLLAGLCLSLPDIAAQGTLCSNAHSLVLNGVIQQFSTSSATATPAICSNTSSGTSPVTWFSFTTNAAAECPLLQISVSDGQPCEIALYSWCGTTISSFLVPASSMCFDDGEGLWAPNENYVLQPNRTYYLRIKTATACTISIGGQHITPSNTTCSGALPVGTQPIQDNNACHKPAAGLQPSQLCALNLENTAFYKFYVATPGSAVINISNISCDNGNGNNSSGFQVGFFTGSCQSLNPVNCETGSGSFVQATTLPLPAGSLVFVAIDGVSGSNCRYQVSGLNVYGVLSTNFKNFSGWKKPYSNLIRWTCLNDSSSHYLVERSVDGAHFETIGMVAGSTQASADYHYEDNNPKDKSFYRVRQVDRQGQHLLSSIISLVRNEGALSTLKITGTDGGTVQFEVSTPEEQEAYYLILNAAGQEFAVQKIKLHKGVNRIRKHILLPAGKYFVVLQMKDARISAGFFRG